jgi:acetyl-CoA acetyltransferase
VPPRGRILADKVAFAGVGFAGLVRDAGVSADVLTVDACLAALDDAGLNVSDVDGLTQNAWGVTPSTVDVQETLGIPTLSWFADLTGVPAGLGPVILAAEAVASRMCSVALVYRTVLRNRVSHGGVNEMPSLEARGESQFLSPYGSASATQWAAMFCQRHMHQYGTNHEHLGTLCVDQRSKAALNPRAIFKAPMTLDDYHNSRWISYPFHLFDCDVPIDSSVAIVLVAPEVVTGLRRAPVWVEAAAMATGPRPSWEQWDDMTHTAGKYAAQMLWTRTALGPSDIDVAQLYDGFSWFTLSWLESLGFCGVGEGGPFVLEGHTALSGRLPTNTDGGQLSAGRTHGIGKVAECVLQLRGEAGERQVSGARVGIMATGAYFRAATMIARADG